jgi:hypothetical protein
MCVSERSVFIVCVREKDYARVFNKTQDVETNSQTDVQI